MNFMKRSVKLPGGKRVKNAKVFIMVFLSLVLLQALLGSISFKMLFNLQAFQIIAAGILISVFISYPMDTLVNTYKTIKLSYGADPDYDEVINKMYGLSVKIKKDGVLSIKDDIEYEEDIFIRDAMILLNDYKKEEAIADIMDHDIESRYIELNKPYKVVEMVANIAPAFGLIGTLVGMIGLLSGINEPAMIMGNMASALVSTLYGSLIANFLAFPTMARIQAYNEEQILKYRMIKEGILLIAKEDTTRNVFDKMNVMLREDKRLTYPKRQVQEKKGVDHYGMEEFLQGS